MARLSREMGLGRTARQNAEIPVERRGGRGRPAKGSGSVWIRRGFPSLACPIWAILHKTTADNRRRLRSYGGDDTRGPVVRRDQCAHLAEIESRGLRLPSGVIAHQTENKKSNPFWGWPAPSKHRLCATRSTLDSLRLGRDFRDAWGYCRQNPLMLKSMDFWLLSCACILLDIRIEATAALLGASPGLLAHIRHPCCPSSPALRVLSCPQKKMMMTTRRQLLLANVQRLWS